MIFTINDISNWANMNGIPLGLKLTTFPFTVYMAYFEDDEEIVNNFIVNYVPLGIVIKKFPIKRMIGFNLQQYIEEIKEREK